jgi:hypothetical protein
MDMARTYANPRAGSRLRRARFPLRGPPYMIGRWVSEISRFGLAEPRGGFAFPEVVAD